MKKMWIAGMLVSCLVVIGLAGCSSKTETKTVKYPAYPEYAASEYVKLGDYKSLTVQANLVSEEPTEDDILNKIKTSSYAIQLEDTEATAEQGDSVIIDFDGTIDGESFEGGSETEYNVIIGSNTLIPGFEEQLVGMKVGDTKTLNISFPNDYQNETLKGKTAKFKVVMKNISRIPELSDDSVQEMTNGKYQTVSDYKDAMKKELTASLKEQNHAEKQNVILAQLKADAKIEKLPDVLVSWYVDSVLTTYEVQAKANEQSLDKFIESATEGEMKSEKELRDSLKKTAEDVLSTDVILRAIAEKEKIDVSDKEYKEQLDDMASRYGFASGEDFEASYDKTVIESEMLLDKVLDTLIETTTFGDGHDE